LLGWLLMADMLAWLPLTASVYAWGFSPSAVVVLSVLAVLPWLVWGAKLVLPQPAGMSPLGLLVLVLTAFVFTRLPSGNVWDALLDPWLWVVLHGLVLKKLILRARCFYVAHQRTLTGK
jgi:hypothetical protein